MVSAQTEDSMDKLLENLATRRRRPVLCLSCEMDWTCVDAVRKIADRLEMVDKLSVLLESPGGDIECAYRAVLALREVVDDIEILVPGWAKSAATFFCLAADSIYLGRYGELGPLDPQMLDRTGSARQVSALESSKALEPLLEYSLESLEGIILLLLSRTPMDIPNAIEHAHPLFSAIVSPLYAQVDPHELGESVRVLSISEEYAARVMRRWGYRDLGSNELRQIARRLVWDYPTHGFVIDLMEAKEIGLKAKRLDTESDGLCRDIIGGADPFIGIAFPSTQDIPPGSHTEEASLSEGLDDVEPEREQIATEKRSSD